MNENGSFLTNILCHVLHSRFYRFFLSEGNSVVTTFQQSLKNEIEQYRKAKSKEILTLMRPQQ